MFTVILWIQYIFVLLVFLVAGFIFSVGVVRVWLPTSMKKVGDIFTKEDFSEKNRDCLPPEIKNLNNDQK